MNCSDVDTQTLIAVSSVDSPKFWVGPKFLILG